MIHDLQISLKGKKKEEWVNSYLYNQLLTLQNNTIKGVGFYCGAVHNDSVRVLQVWVKWTVFPFGQILGNISICSDSITQLLKYYEEVDLELQMEQAGRS